MQGAGQGQGSEGAGNETGGSSTAVAIADTQTAMLAKQIRDRVLWRFNIELCII